MVRHSIEFLEKKKAKLLEKSIRMSREALYQIKKVEEAGFRKAEEHKNAKRFERAIHVLKDTAIKRDIVDGLYKGYIERVNGQIEEVDREIAALPPVDQA